MKSFADVVRIFLAVATPYFRSEDRIRGLLLLAAVVAAELGLVWVAVAVTHWNAGAIVLPRASNAAGERATLRAWNLAGSAIWLAHPRFNVMLEASWTRAEEVVGPGTARAAELALVMPGVRWAHDFRNGLQIVPGVGYAIDVKSAGGDALVIYLSFEHGF